MKVLKVELEGLTCSFRYPHFVQGKQPTFEIPPPATIYGHICSVVGEFIDKKGLRIGYNFTYQKKSEDLEHVHLLTAKEPSRRNNYIAAEGNINVFKREFLFKPKLTLYINKPEYYDCFKSPVYPVVLGRSQDLAEYTSIKVIELEEKENIYFKDTLLPLKYHTNICKGIFVLMPRVLDYENNRHPDFDQYLVLKGKPAKFLHNGSVEKFLVDPTEELVDGCSRALYLHSFE